MQPLENSVAGSRKRSTGRRKLHNVGVQGNLMIDKCAKMRLIISFYPLWIVLKTYGRERDISLFQGSGLLDGILNI
jgi:hypothetical protein